MAGGCVEGVFGLLLKSSSVIFPVTGDIVLIRVVRQYASSPGLVEERVCKHLRPILGMLFLLLPPNPSPLSVGPLSPPLKSNKVPLPPEAKPRAFLS